MTPPPRKPQREPDEPPSSRRPNRDDDGPDLEGDEYLIARRLGKRWTEVE